eukprot:COSAG05_NODE_175_length_14930_cov_7.138679_5_plen_135_part_00
MDSVHSCQPSDNNVTVVSLSLSHTRFRGLAGLTMKPGTVGWTQLRIAPQAYNFWSFPAGVSSLFPAEVKITGAMWGDNCHNRSSVQDMKAAVQEVCTGKSRCTFPYVLLFGCSPPCTLPRRVRVDTIVHFSIHD